MARLQLADLDFNSVARPINVPTPVNPGDAANRAYVDSAIEGLAWKDSVRVAAQGNVNLAAPGATLDGVTMVAGDRFLAPLQTAGSENGVYVWNGAATPATRAADCNTFPELEQAVVTVEEGTGAGVSYRQTVVNGTLGTTAPSWTTFGTVAPSASTTTAGVARIGTQAEVDAGALSNVIVTPATLAAWAGRKFKYETTFGDASATQFTISHNFNTRGVHVAVYRNSGAYDEVGCDVEHTTVNSCTLRFASPPTAGQFAVVVLG